MQDTHSPIQHLDYENLDVYRCSLEFLAFAFQVIDSLQRGDGELRDQLRRASISVVLNIAEGAGKSSAPDRARFHAIARGSAMECGALVDVGVVAGRRDPAAAQRGKALLVRSVSRLTRMCR